MSAYSIKGDVPDNLRIFVGGIPDEKSKYDIWKELIANGIFKIVDIIMYRSYVDRRKNRGYVFVEFTNHVIAAATLKNNKNLHLFGKPVFLDWSNPVTNIPNTVMDKVKIVFIRGLSLDLNKEKLRSLLMRVLGVNTVFEKIYKYRDYAFVHFFSRREAQRAISLLRHAFENADDFNHVEVVWARPAICNELLARNNRSCGLCDTFINTPPVPLFASQPPTTSNSAHFQSLGSEISNAACTCGANTFSPNVPTTTSLRNTIAGTRMSNYVPEPDTSEITAMLRNIWTKNDIF